MTLGYARDGSPDVAYLDSALPGDILLNDFINRVKNELMPQITKCNSRQVQASIRVELFCDIAIQISINNSQVVSKIGPTFANGLYGPTVSDDGDVLTMIGDTLERIDQRVDDAQTAMFRNGSLNIAPTPQYIPQNNTVTPTNAQPATQNLKDKGSSLF